MQIEASLGLGEIGLKKHNNKGNNPNTFKKHTPKRVELSQEKRKKANNLYRTNRWKEVRLKILNLSPFCDCGKTAKVVDHIQAHLGREDYFFDENNLRSMCTSCHNRKTAKEDNKRNKSGKFVSKY